MKRNSQLTTLVLILLAIVVMSMAISARADSRCSLASLNGTYAFQGEGTIVAQLDSLPPPPAAFGQVGTITFNGAGTFFGSSTQNFGGAAANATFTGIYTINSDCTGTLTANTSLGLIAHDATVLIDGGQRFIDTETDTFAVVNRRGEKLVQGD